METRPGFCRRRRRIGLLMLDDQTADYGLETAYHSLMGAFCFRLRPDNDTAESKDWTERLRSQWRCPEGQCDVKKLDDEMQRERDATQELGE
jgi:hypothetical protein